MPINESTARIGIERYVSFRKRRKKNKNHVWRLPQYMIAYTTNEISKRAQKKITHKTELQNQTGQ